MNSEKQTFAELIATLAGLFLVVAFAPLSSRYFPGVMAAVIVATVAYLLRSGTRQPERWEEWGFLPHEDAREDRGYGCIFVGYLMLFSVGFIFLGFASRAFLRGYKRR